LMLSASLKDICHFSPEIQITHPVTDSHQQIPAKIGICRLYAVSRGGVHKLKLIRHKRASEPNHRVFLDQINCLTVRRINLDFFLSLVWPRPLLRVGHVEVIQPMPMQNVLPSNIKSGRILSAKQISSDTTHRRSIVLAAFIEISGDEAHCDPPTGQQNPEKLRTHSLP